MTTARLLRLLFASLISIGLAVAPLVAPAAASGMASGPASPDMSMMQMADMPADMACCPEEEQKQSGCHDCPLLAMCVLKVLQAGPAVVTAIRYARPLALLRPLDDAIADGLVRPPPDHPPRSIV
ncbi:hypothetical protein N2603_20785 [Bradyrhizobium huanghuaihaiense]|uniref:hypothetical protein n=1 Tax=Bradyrhizobium huanghuaihaiense TaxID=990078 RepID=UPI0021A9EF5A|nr:hypothetical protein [Bradyrhizobium sp. CB3035]UWU80809.1 hypothetical protein N2603_20785 [Bradyrhizobium sp. CB3035]